MVLKPGAACQFETKTDTRVDFDQVSVSVKYYSFEGNNLPFLSLCQLRDKAARTLLTVWPTGQDVNRPPANELRTGLLGGLLSGFCGYYLEIQNKN